MTATNAGGSTVQTSAAQFVCCPIGPKATAARVVAGQGRNGAAEADLPGGRRTLRRPAPPRIDTAAAQGAILGPQGPKLPNLPVTYGEKSFSVPAGTTKTVKVKLNKRAKSQLRESKGHRLKAALGGSGVTSRTVLLKLAPKPKRGSSDADAAPAGSVGRDGP